MILRYVIIVAAALTLQGCWFVFIPGSLISGAADAMSGNQGQNCVGETARVGDRIRLNDGRIGTVQKLE